MILHMLREGCCLNIHYGTDSRLPGSSAITPTPVCSPNLASTQPSHKSPAHITLLKLPPSTFKLPSADEVLTRGFLASSIVSTPLFAPYLFRTQPCLQIPCRNRNQCTGFHSSLDRRRLPILYRADLCSDMQTSGSCPFGDSCVFAHNWSERLYHPRFFGRFACMKNQLHQVDPTTYPPCPRGYCCAFRHTVPIWTSAFLQSTPSSASVPEDEKSSCVSPSVSPTPTETSTVSSSSASSDSVQPASVRQTISTGTTRTRRRRRQRLRNHGPRAQL
jgi:hypothetical protein